VLFTSSEELEDEYNPARKAIDKFLFLADRLISVCDTEEAYEYEMQRIRKIFDLDAAEVKSRCAAVARPFYASALSAAVAKADTLKPSALQSAQRTLGISEAMRESMHLEVYRQQAEALIDGSKLAEGGVDKLAKLGYVLSLSEEQQRQELEAVTVPVYELAVAKELEGAVKVCAYEIIATITSN
jgi:Chloroplast envelope transporter